MSITITDPVLLAQLAALQGSVEVHGPNGEFVGTFAAKVKSPVSDEELERRRQTYHDGKPLSEILRELESRNGA